LAPDERRGRTLQALTGSPGREGYEPENVHLVTAVANFAMNAWGLEPVLDLARAMAQKHAEEVRDPSDQAWLARQNARIAEAEREAAQLAGEAQKRARWPIAALKRALWSLIGMQLFAISRTS
jgi:hypothetical protein